MAARPVWDYGSLYECGHVTLRDRERQWWLLDAATGMGTPFAADIKHLSSLSESAFAYSEDGRLYGIVDRDGRVALPPTYADISPIPSRGSAAYSRALNLRGIVSTGGEVILEPRYRTLFAGESGLIAAEEETDRNGGDGRAKSMGYLDWSGEWVIKPRFHSAQAFHGGLAGVQEEFGGLMGFIDESGDYVVPPRFESVNPFSGGFASVYEEDGPMYYIDRSGARVSDFFTYCGDVAEGRAPVCIGGSWEHEEGTRGGRWAFLDENFRVMKCPRVDAAESFQDGLARVYRGDTANYAAKEGYLNRDMEWVWVPSR